MKKNYNRTIGPAGMLLSCITTIIGSGWLFSGYYSAQIAGPAALLSWVLGAVLILIVAATFVELSTMVAVPGGSSHFPHLTHGTLVSTVLGWISWLSVATLPPIEVQAVLQYASFFFNGLTVTDAQGTGALTHMGLCIAVFLMLFFSVINIYSLRWVMRLNNSVAIWKIIIPVVAAITLIIYGFKSENFTQYSFFSQGSRGLFEAISAGGIVFAYNGFKTVVEMAGEAKDPKKTIPIALIGSIVLSMFIYVLLQFAFLGAIPSDALANGWAHLVLSQAQSPLITLLVGVGSVVVLALLCVDTLVAPMGAGLMYATSGARILQAMGQNKQMPKLMADLNTSGIPVPAILINFVLGLLFFLPFPGWRNMMEFISSLMAFSYALGPVCLLVLRYQLPNLTRKIRIPFVHLWSFLAFYICTLMCYWTGWSVISKLDLFLAACLGSYLIYRLISSRARSVRLDIKPSIWIWAFFSGLAVISYLGNFGGGTNVLGFGQDFVAIAALSVLTLTLAVRYRLADHVVAEKINRLQEYYQHEPKPEPPAVTDDGIANVSAVRPQSAV